MTATQTPLELYHQHAARWQNCQGCDLCAQRKQVVLARGAVPCDLMLVGEAPGMSEDVLGLPFVGPAGKLLDQIVERALSRWRVGDNGLTYNRVSHCFANLVACFPKEAKQTDNHEPAPEEIEACAPRLRQFVEIADPGIIVAVGRLADDWLHLALADTKFDPSGLGTKPWVQVTHPAAILRMPAAQQSMAARKCIITIEAAVKKHRGET